jgi:hypothetical protein
MGTKGSRGTAKGPGGDMLHRLQGILYEFHDMGRFEEARPHILWLMEIVERQGDRLEPPPRMLDG